MKTIDLVTIKEQLSDYFSEESLERAIKNLETSSFTHEERAAYEIELAKRGALIQYLEDEKEKIVKQVIEKETKKFFAAKLINQGELSLEEIADLVELPLKEVQALKGEMKK